MNSPHLPHPKLQELAYQYQPIFAAHGDSEYWFEALVRWKLPDGTIRGPLEILPYWLAPARRENFTRFTIQQAAKVLQEHPDVVVSVNLSPEQIASPTGLEALKGLHPELQQRLIIELTEQQIPNARAYWRALNDLRGECSMVLLDDVTFDDLDMRFRAGAPIDGIKLDRSLLPALLGGTYQQRALDLVEDARDRFAVIVAEGVEDPAVLDTLGELGISHLQGFGLGRPSASIETASEDVRRHRDATPTRVMPIPAHLHK